VVTFAVVAAAAPVQPDSPTTVSAASKAAGNKNLVCFILFPPYIKYLFVIKTLIRL
jgi:hypothetical protein